jgi:hypothetical protein
LEKSNSLKLFITAFVVVVLALAFIVSIADQTKTVTERTQTSQTFAGAGCFTPVNLTGTDFTTLHTQANGPTDADCNFTVTNVPTGWKLETASNCLLVATVSNGTSTALTLDTDYYFNTATGKVTLLNTSTNTRVLTNNNTLVSYTYCSDDYLNTSWGRTILNTNVGFLAIAVLAVVLWLVYVLLERKKNEEY